MPGPAALAAPPAVPPPAWSSPCRATASTRPRPRTRPTYTITWLGPDGGQVIPLPTDQSVVYDPSTNVDVASGTTYPTAVSRPYLLFDQPLPAGSYQIQLPPAVQTAAFNPDELALLIRQRLHRTPGGVARGRQVTAGIRLLAKTWCRSAGTLGNLAVWNSGTPFLSQLHDDPGALLAQTQTAGDDDPQITSLLIEQTLERLAPALGGGGGAADGAAGAVVRPGVAGPGRSDRPRHQLQPGHGPVEQRHRRLVCSAGGQHRGGGGGRARDRNLDLHPESGQRTCQRPRRRGLAGQRGHPDDVSDQPAPERDLGLHLRVHGVHQPLALAKAVPPEPNASSPAAARRW